MQGQTRAQLIEKGYKAGNTARCSGCDVLIRWFTTPVGRSMPFEDAEDETLVPHWAKCPKAKEFKKKVWNRRPTT